jgi:hypothetical protein
MDNYRLSYDLMGASTCDIRCQLSTAQRETSIGAKLEILGDRGVIWTGYVDDIDFQSLTGVGFQTLLDGKPHASLYSWDGVDSWRSRSNTAPQPNVSTGVDSLNVTFEHESEYIFSGSEPQQAAIELPLPTRFEGTQIRVTGFVQRSSTQITTVRLNPAALLSSPDAAGNKYLHYGALGVDLPGSGTTTAHSFDVTITNPSGDTDALMIFFVGSLTANASVTLSSLRVHTELADVSDAANCIVQNILRPIATRLGVEYDITDTTNLDPFAQPVVAATDRQRVNDVLDLTGKQFIFRQRVAGLTACLEPIPTEPRYHLTRDFVSDLNRTRFSEMMSAIRVTFTDKNGDARFADVVDNDQTHYLVDRGIVKWGTLAVDTTTRIQAIAAANEYFERQHVWSLSGFVALKDGSSGISAEAWEPNTVVRIDDPDFGTVNGLITAVEHSNGAVNLTIGSVADIQTLIARSVERRRRAGA